MSWGRFFSRCHVASAHISLRYKVPLNASQQTYASHWGTTPPRGLVATNNRVTTSPQMNKFPGSPPRQIRNTMLLSTNYACTYQREVGNSRVNNYLLGKWWKIFPRQDSSPATPLVYLLSSFAVVKSPAPSTYPRVSDKNATLLRYEEMWRDREVAGSTFSRSMPPECRAIYSFVYGSNGRASWRTARWPHFLQRACTGYLCSLMFFASHVSSVFAFKCVESVLFYTWWVFAIIYWVAQKSKPLPNDQ